MYSFISFNDVLIQKYRWKHCNSYILQRIDACSAIKLTGHWINSEIFEWPRLLICTDEIYQCYLLMFDFEALCLRKPICSHSISSFHWRFLAGCMVQVLWMLDCKYYFFSLAFAPWSSNATMTFVAFEKRWTGYERLLFACIRWKAPIGCVDSSFIHFPHAIFHLTRFKKPLRWTVLSTLPLSSRQSLLIRLETVEMHANDRRSLHFAGNCLEDRILCISVMNISIYIIILMEKP